MSKRRKYTVLHVAIGAAAVISVGLATVSTAQIIRNRQMHGSAPVNEETAARQQQELREDAATKEKAERQQDQAAKNLRELRMGN